MSVFYDMMPPAEDVSIALISSEANRNSLFPLVIVSPEGASGFFFFFDGPAAV